MLDNCVYIQWAFAMQRLMQISTATIGDCVCVCFIVFWYLHIIFTETFLFMRGFAIVFVHLKYLFCVCRSALSKYDPPMEKRQCDLFINKKICILAVQYDCLNNKNSYWKYFCNHPRKMNTNTYKKLLFNSKRIYILVFTFDLAVQFNILKPETYVKALLNALSLCLYWFSLRQVPTWMYRK